MMETAPGLSLPLRATHYREQQQWILGIETQWKLLERRQKVCMWRESVCDWHLPLPVSRMRCVT